MGYRFLPIGRVTASRESCCCRVLAAAWFLLVVVFLSLPSSSYCRESEITISGVVVTPDGRPVPGVRVCRSFTLCLMSDAKGRFQDSSRHWNYSGELYVSKPGFVSAILTPHRPWQDLRLEIREGSGRTAVLGPCRSERYRRVKYFSLKVLVPDEVEMVQYSGYDDFGFSIRFGNHEDSGSMHFISGSHIAILPISTWIRSHSTVDLTELFRVSDPGGKPELVGLDVRGERPDGRRSRRVSATGEYIEYYDASRAAAAFFDSILQTLCIDRPTW